MKKTRKRHKAAFKTKVGLEALKCNLTIAQIAKDYQVHPTQVCQWKNVLLERLPNLFTCGPTAEAKQRELELARLHKKVGELTMELDWLKIGPVP